MADKGKAVIAFLYAAAVVIVPFVDRGTDVLPSEFVQMFIAVVTAAAVYLAPIIPQSAGVKTALGALLAGLQVLVTIVDGGVHGNDVLMIVFAVCAALGIALAPAASVNGTRVGWGSDAVKAVGAR